MWQGEKSEEKTAEGTNENKEECQTGNSGKFIKRLTCSA